MSFSLFRGASESTIEGPKKLIDKCLHLTIGVRPQKFCLNPFKSSSGLNTSLLLTLNLHF